MKTINDTGQFHGAGSPADDLAADLAAHCVDSARVGTVSILVYRLKSDCPLHRLERDYLAAVLNGDEKLPGKPKRIDSLDRENIKAIYETSMDSKINSGQKSLGKRIKAALAKAYKTTDDTIEDIVYEGKKGTEKSTEKRPEKIKKLRRV